MCTSPTGCPTCSTNCYPCQPICKQTEPTNGRLVGYCSRVLTAFGHSSIQMQNNLSNATRTTLSAAWLVAAFSDSKQVSNSVTIGTPWGWWGELAFSKVPGLGSSKGILRTRCLQSGLSFRIAESMQAAYQIWRESEVFHDFKMFARWYPTDCGSTMVRAENICLTEWFKEHTVQIFSIANIWRGS